MPLADGACDVLFVSHVLEHLAQPDDFIREAKRCARHIYLEFPTLTRELMYAWSFHKWLIEVRDGQLVFYQNDIPQIFGDFFHRHHDFLLDTWSSERFEELNTYLYVPTDELACSFSRQTALEYLLERSVEGEGKINFETEYGQTGTTRLSYSTATRLKILLWTITPSSLVRTRNRLTQWWNRSRRRELTHSTIARLMCQKCRAGSLRLKRGSSPREMVCGQCGACYAAHRGVFDFDV
jgi:hypothetical protein